MRSSVIAMAAAILPFCSTVLAHAQPAGEFSEQGPADETAFRREGFAIGVSLGPSLLLGAGSKNELRGGGGGFGIRMGTSAGEKLLWFVQLDAATRSKTSGVSVLSVGAHYYVREAFWLRGGFGFSSVVSRRENVLGDFETKTEGSLALIGGGGVDVFRRGIFAIDLELSLSRAPYKDGSMTVGSLQLAANWY